MPTFVDYGFGFLPQLKMRLETRAPVPGRPAEAVAPCLPMVSQVPRLPSETDTPVALRLSRTPGAMGIDRKNLNAIL